MISQGGIVLRWHHLALAATVILGAFFRLYRIDVIHQEMGCDLPHIYNNIRYLLRSEFLVFFPSYPGREGLFFYVAAPFCRVFGLNHINIKIVSALVGVLTIPLIYLLGKELFDREVGLLAAFFLSTCRWHIILTRMGYRMCTLPPILILLSLFLVQAWRSQELKWYALAGLFLGLGFYTYNAFMIVPLLVALMIVWALVRDRPPPGRRDWLRARVTGVILLGGVAAYTLIPLARYAYEEPDSYGYRTLTRVTGMERALPEDLVATFMSNTGKVLGMFNYRGDGQSVLNVPFARALSYAAAILFVLGAVYMVWRWRDGFNLSVLIALGVMLLPTSLSLAFPNEVPNAGRSIGAVPAAMLMPAVALALVRRRVAARLAQGAGQGWQIRFTVDGRPWIDGPVQWGRIRAALLVGGLIVALALETRALYAFYFQDYVEGLPEQGHSISLSMARAIDDFYDDGEAYIKVAPYWYDGNAVRAQLRKTDQNWHNEIGELQPGMPPLSGPPGKLMVILHPQDEAGLQTLQAAFPRGLYLTNLDNQGRAAFLTFYGER